MKTHRFVTALFALFALLVIGCGGSESSTAQKEAQAKANEKLASLPTPDPRGGLDRVANESATRLADTLKQLEELKKKNQEMIAMYGAQSTVLDEMVFQVRSLKESVEKEQKQVNDAFAARESALAESKSTSEAQPTTGGSGSFLFAIIVIILLIVIIIFFVKWLLSPSEDNYDDDDEFDFEDEFFDDEEDDDFGDDADKSKKNENKGDKA